MIFFVVSANRPMCWYNVNVVQVEKKSWYWVIRRMTIFCLINNIWNVKKERNYRNNVKDCLHYNVENRYSTILSTPQWNWCTCCTNRIQRINYRPVERRCHENACIHTKRCWRGSAPPEILKKCSFQNSRKNTLLK